MNSKRSLRNLRWFPDSFGNGRRPSSECDWFASTKIINFSKKAVIASIFSLNSVTRRTTHEIHDDTRRDDWRRVHWVRVMFFFGHVWRVDKIAYSHSILPRHFWCAHRYMRVAKIVNRFIWIFIVFCCCCVEVGTEKHTGYTPDVDVMIYDSLCQPKTNYRFESIH